MHGLTIKRNAFLCNSSSLWPPFTVTPTCVHDVSWIEWLCSLDGGLGLHLLTPAQCLLHRTYSITTIGWMNKLVSSITQSCPTLCDSMDCSTPGIFVYHQLPEHTQTHVHWVSDAIQPSHHLLFPSFPHSIFPSIRVFSNESVLQIRWPKYWSFNFSISPSNEYSGLISFRMDWLDLLEVQGTLKSLLQHHSSKASILQHSAFFIVQISHSYVTTGKTKALTRQTFVGKVISLLFNMLSRLVEWMSRLNE